MKNIDGYRWPKFESLFSESFDDTSYGQEDLIGSFSEDHEPEARTLEEYISVQSIAVFEQAFPGIDYKDTYASFDSYLDGSIYMYRGDIRSIDHKAYWEVKINLHAHHGVSTETSQILDYRTNQLLDDWPDPTKTPPAPDDQSSATPDDIPF